MTQGTQYSENFIWKSTNIGADKLQIHPEDSNFTTGTYYLGVLGYKPDLNTFSVVYRQEFVPESFLLLDSHKSTLSNWQYFKFPINFAGESRLEVTVRPGLGHIELYASSSLFFPNEEEHTWSSGVYVPDPQSDSEDPTRENQFDPDPYDQVLKRCFTRKPTGRELIKLSKVEHPTDEDLRFCIDTDDWKYSNQTCYIGLKNLTSQSVEFTISKREVLEEELLIGHIYEKYEIFKTLFAKVEGSSISQNERKRMNCTGKSEFTYGEVDFVHIAPIFELCKPKDGEVFWDLGCGAGKCMVAMALLYPNMAKIAGVEFLDLLYESCENTANQFRNIVKDGPGIEVYHGDMLKTDWSDADILFSSSICFPNELIEGILEKSHSLKKGARFITLKNFPMNSIFEVKYSTRVKMTWGKTGVYVLEKVV